MSVCVRELRPENEPPTTTGVDETADSTQGQEWFPFPPARLENLITWRHLAEDEDQVLQQWGKMSPTLDAAPALPNEL